MNLNNQPTINELAELFAGRKDTLDDHIVWINEAGEVRVDPLTHCAEETEFEKQHPQMRARLKMYRRGQGYVGKKAAADTHFMEKILHNLTLTWEKAKEEPAVVKVNSYC